MKITDPAAWAGGVRRAQTLFVDADDTLWENNVFFDAVVADYCALLGPRGVDPNDARDRLLAIERIRTKTHGYGVDNFARALREACAELLGDHHGDIADVLEQLARSIRRERVRLLPNVAATLRELAGRHRLVLLTKGHRDDQLAKLHRSGLHPLLHEVDVVVEKDPAAYRSALARHGARADEAWMVGNSPRSDVLPALDAGLGAVYVPHHATWTLELETLPRQGHPRLLVLERFDQITGYF